MTTATLVAMESGSEWPAQIGDSTVVGLASSGDDDLVQRTRATLDLLRRDRHHVRVAVVTCNAETGAAAGSRRASLARTLLDAVTGSIRERLILSASDRASDQLRRELFALAGELTAELRGSTATVSLWFMEPSRGHARPLVDTRPRSLMRASA
jgi:hypothetical protein